MIRPGQYLAGSSQSASVRLWRIQTGRMDGCGFCRDRYCGPVLLSNAHPDHLFFCIKVNLYMKAAIKGVRPFVVGLLVWTAYQIAIPVFGLDKRGLGTWLRGTAGKMADCPGFFSGADFYRHQPDLTCTGYKRDRVDFLSLKSLPDNQVLLNAKAVVSRQGNCGSHPPVAG